MPSIPPLWCIALSTSFSTVVTGFLIAKTETILAIYKMQTSKFKLQWWIADLNDIDGEGARWLNSGWRGCEVALFCCEQQSTERNKSDSNDVLQLTDKMSSSQLVSLLSTFKRSLSNWSDAMSNRSAEYPHSLIRFAWTFWIISFLCSTVKSSNVANIDCKIT